mmetsp:Transcript_15938/g.46499  ORF Transcript_15938/g.46499 Transcript_15938/m.46499 type:complete len:334 (-) Transcript_15938:340-1341(-)
MGAVESVVNKVAFPAPPRAYSESQLRLHPDLVFLCTRRGLRIPAVHKRVARAGHRYTLIYSHGNAEDVGLSLPYLDHISKLLDVDVLAYEYVGYSIADGRPSEQGVYDSINAAFAYLTGECGVAPEGVVLLGRSLGSAPTVHLAAQQPHLAGMILQSPLASGVRVLSGVAASFFLAPCDPFRNYAKVRRVRCPSVVLHGTADEVVPFWNGKCLHEALHARGLAFEPFWATGRGHNDMPEDACVQHMRKFLATLPPPPPPQGVGASGGTTLALARLINYDGGLGGRLDDSRGSREPLRGRARDSPAAGSVAPEPWQPEPPRGGTSLAPVRIDAS